MESYIITSPSGEKIDTRLEFPIEQPATWQDYVILKAASEELAENMDKDGKGKNQQVMRLIILFLLKKIDLFLDLMLNRLEKY